MWSNWCICFGICEDLTVLALLDELSHFQIHIVEEEVCS